MKQLKAILFISFLEKLVDLELESHDIELRLLRHSDGSKEIIALLKARGRQRIYG
ncbi:hypothetical protein [Aliivibrio kagoshimensis]|uniref:hypothetical protein n=1 Tax=Aliivibrio kagoshimensis TaxID=2910230 RepID=UPI003D0E2D98